METRVSVKLEQVDAETVRVEVGGKAYLIPAACPHRKGRMVFCRVHETRLTVTCPLHYSTFDLQTGDKVAGPASAPLQVRPLPSSAPDHGT